LTGTDNSMLKELQKNFKAHLMTGDKNIFSEIVSTEELSNQDRLAIYGNAYYARLEEALQGDFEAIHTLLGDDEFSMLCRRYTDAHPSRFFSLRWFGQYMPEFLASTQPYSSYPYLAEMAQFEWRFTDAFDAKDSTSVSENDIANIPAENWPFLSVNFHPSVCWVKYQWNILPVWKAVKENSDIPEIVKLPELQTAMIWRQNLVTRYRTMEREEANLVAIAGAGKDFSAWCETLIEMGELPENVPLKVAGVLRTWIGLEMISNLKW